MSAQPHRSSLSPIRICSECQNDSGDRRTIPGTLGASRIADILYGSTGKAIIDLHLHATESYGRLRAVGRSGVSRLIRRLAASGHLLFDGLEYPVVILSAKGAAVLNSGEPLVWEQDHLPVASTSRERRSTQVTNTGGSAHPIGSSYRPS